MTSHSGLYVKMRHPSRPQQPPVFSGEGAEYMNLLYSAVAAQGGGSVEAAMSPYLAMTAPTPDRYHHRVRYLRRDILNHRMSSLKLVCVCVGGGGGEMSLNTLHTTATAVELYMAM